MGRVIHFSFQEMRNWIYYCAILSPVLKRASLVSVQVASPLTNCFPIVGKNYLYAFLIRETKSEAIYQLSPDDGHAHITLGVLTSRPMDHLRVRHALWMIRLQYDGKFSRRINSRFSWLRLRSAKIKLTKCFMLCSVAIKDL